MEYWKEIPNTNGTYSASINGEIKRNVGFQCKKERILKQCDNGNGYKTVAISINSKPKKRYVHRLVAEVFISNQENKEEVNHIDGIRSNNKLSNLEWVTRSENHYHRYEVLKQRGVNYGKIGELNWRSKEVVMLDKDSMEEIAKFPAVMSAMRATGINESNIRSAIYSGGTAGGYIWKYVRDNKARWNG